MSSSVGMGARCATMKEREAGVVEYFAWLISNREFLSVFESVTLERVVGNFRRHSMMVEVDEREKCKDWNER